MARRKVSVELELDALRYLTASKGVLVATKATEEAIEDLGDEADETGRDLEQLAANTDIASRRVDDLGDEAVGAATKLQLLESRLKAAARASRALAADFAGGHISSGVAPAGLPAPKPRGETLDFDAGDAGVRAGRTFASGFASSFGSSGLRSQMILYLVGAAVVASPLIAAVISGAIVGAIGAGGIVGGAFTAARDPGVRAAANLLGQTFVDEFFAAGDELAGPVTRALEGLTDDVKALNLEDLFAKAAPAVEILASGVGMLVKNLMPGLNAIMDNAVPIAHALADGFGDIGDAVSDALVSIVESKGTMEGLVVLLQATAGAIRFTGQALAWLGDVFHYTVAGIGVLTGALERLDPAFAPINDWAERITGTGAEMNRVLSEVDPFVFYKAEAVANVRATSEALAAQAVVVLGLTDTLKGYLDATLAMDNAALAYKQGVLDLTEALKESKGSLDDHTDAGLASQRALLSQVAAAQRVREEIIGQTGDIARANAVYATMIAEIYRVATAAGVSKTALNKMIGDYNININYRVRVNTTYGGAKFLGDDPEGVRGGYPGRAAGGPVMAGGTYRVGEYGPEILQMGSQNGHVYSSVGSWQAATGGGGGNGGAANVNVTVSPKADAGGRLWQAFLDASRYEITQVGAGSTQDHLGRRGPF